MRGEIRAFKRLNLNFPLRATNYFSGREVRRSTVKEERIFPIFMLSLLLSAFGYSGAVQKSEPLPGLVVLDITFKNGERLVKHLRPDQVQDFVVNEESVVKCTAAYLFEGTPVCVREADNCDDARAAMYECACLHCLRNPTCPNVGCH